MSSPPKEMKRSSALVVCVALLIPSTGALIPSSSICKSNGAVDACCDRRSLLRDAINSLLGSGMAATCFLTSRPSNAIVYTDPDRYGDKELKIAFVNRLRQNLRDVIVEDPTLAPQFLELVIQDALTYDQTTQTGGPDGSILNAVLNNDSDALSRLKPAAQKLQALAADRKRSTEITNADLVTFAGAEAIEAMGGPRMTVQVGKLDPDKPTKRDNYPRLDVASEALPAFDKAGLNARDVAILYGALAAMNASVKLLKDMKSDEETDDFEEDNEMGDPDVFVPTTFGSSSDIYGKRIGTMDNEVFINAVKALKQKRDPEADVFTDKQVMEWATTYSKKNAAFLQDLPLAYQRLVSVGKSYTGGKIGTLLGPGLDQI